MCVFASVVPCLHQSLPKMGTAMSNQVGHLLFVLDFSRLDSPKLACVGLTPRSALLLAQNCLCKPLLPSMTNFLWEFILQRFKFMVLLISCLLGTIDIICLLDLVLQTTWFYHEKIMKSWFFSLADVCRWWHLNFADFNRYFLLMSMFATLIRSLEGSNTTMTTFELYDSTTQDQIRVCHWSSNIKFTVILLHSLSFN